jgi:hypothetical protein
MEYEEINEGEIGNGITKRNRLKNWKYFFTEFLMIFLGVTAGFFVDEFRQTRDERSEEIAYMKSYLKDLEKDRTELAFNSEFGKVSIMGSDSLLNELIRQPLKGREKKLYHYFNLQNTGFLFPHHDRTITQLKYSGKFRIIDNQEVADALIDYDSKLTLASEMNIGLYKTNISNNTLIDIAKIFDLPRASKYSHEALSNKEDMNKVNYPSDLKLLSYDEGTIMQLRNTLIQSRDADVGFLAINDELLKANIALDSLIRKEYF